MQVRKLSNEEKNNGILGVTLLSDKEYETSVGVIPMLGKRFWLQSPAGYDYPNKKADTMCAMVGVVGANNKVSDNGSKADTKQGVRPALLIDNSVLKLKTNDKVTINDLTYTVVSDTKILCDSIIGTTVFNRTAAEEKDCSFENSDLKLWLEKWLDNEQKKHEISIKLKDVTIPSGEEIERWTSRIPSENKWYWLRSADKEQGIAGIAGKNNKINAYGDDVDNKNGVRPLLLFDTEDCDLISGAKITKNEVVYTVISSGVMIADKIVGTTHFNSAKDSEVSNDYSKSDVKKWLDDWAKSEFGEDYYSGTVSVVLQNADMIRTKDTEPAVIKKFDEVGFIAPAAEAVAEAEAVTEVEAVKEPEVVAEVEAATVVEETAKAETIAEVEAVAESEAIAEVETVAETEAAPIVEEIKEVENTAQTEVIAEVEDVAKTEVIAEVVTEVENVAQAEAVTETAVVTEVEAVAEAEAATVVEEITEAETVAAEEIENVVEAEAITEIETTAKVEEIAEVENAVQTEVIAEAENIAKAEEIVEVEAAVQAETVAETESIVEAETSAQAEAVPEVEKVAQTETITVTESTATTQVATQSEIDIKAARVLSAEEEYYNSIYELRLSKWERRCDEILAERDVLYSELLGKEYDRIEEEIKQRNIPVIERCQRHIDIIRLKKGDYELQLDRLGALRFGEKKKLRASMVKCDIEIADYESKLKILQKAYEEEMTEIRPRLEKAEPDIYKQVEERLPFPDRPEKPDGFAYSEKNSDLDVK